MAKSMQVVYVLENQLDKSWDIGQTSNLQKRVERHNSGNGAKVTKLKGPVWKLIYAEAYSDKRDALGREKFLKGGSGRTFLKKQMRYYLQTNSMS